MASIHIEALNRDMAPQACRMLAQALLTCPRHVGRKHFVCHQPAEHRCIRPITARQERGVLPGWAGSDERAQAGRDRRISDPRPDSLGIFSGLPVLVV